MGKKQIREIERGFLESGIPIDKPGFFDHPDFLAQESRNPSYLNEYGRYVYWRQYDEGYLARAEKTIRIASDELHRGLVLDGRLGACIDTSMTLARILDLHGIWNCVIAGSILMEFSSTSGYQPFGLWAVDRNDGSGRQDGHKWLYAPPFLVVDLTIRLQEWPQPFHNLLPEKVLSRNAESVPFCPENILCPAAVAYGASGGLNAHETFTKMVPKSMHPFLLEFPTYKIVDPSGVKLTYAPLRIGGSDAPLERIRSLVIKGQSAFKFYKQNILPKLAAEKL